MEDHLVLNIWTILVLIAISQGLFLSIMLFIKREDNRQANVLLGLLILLFSICLYESFALWSQFHVYFPHLMLVYAPCYFLIGPVTYFYFRTIVHHHSFRNRDWLHLLLPVAIVAWRWDFYGSSAREKRTSFLEAAREGYTSTGADLSDSDITLLLAAIHLSVFAYLIHNMLRKSSQLTGNSPQLINGYPKAPFRRIFIFYLGFVISEFAWLVMYNTSYYSFFWDYLVVLSMAILIYGVGYMGYQQKVMKLPVQAPDETEGTTTKRKALTPQKYTNSTLTTQASRSIAKKIREYVEEEKPYLNADLRLPQLAEQLDLSTHHLSQVINKELDKNFTEFVNHYRVEEVKLMMTDPKKEHLTVMDIAYSAGFNNKTSFYKSFKEVTGYSPSAYRKKKLQ